MLVATNLRLCLPGRVRWNQLKPASSQLANYDSVSQKDWGPNGTSNLIPRIWIFAFATWTVIHSKSPMIWRSCSFWRNTDLNGDFGSTTPANPLCSSRVPHSLSYYACNATKLAPVWSCPDTLAGQKRPCCRVFYSLLTPHQHKGFFDFYLIWLWAWAFTSQLNHLIEDWTSLLLSLLLGFSCSGRTYLCKFWCLSLCCTISRISDRLTHGAQTRRDRGGLGVAFEPYPWTRSHQPSASTRHPGCCTLSFWRFWPSYQHHFGTFGDRQYSSWPWNYGPFRYIFGPCTSWCPISDGAKLYTQLPPSCSLLFPRGSPDPIQDLYPLQQHQGAIHWRDPHVRAFQMSWSWTLLLWSFGQLGMVPAHSGLLETPFWNSSSTWTSPFSKRSHCDPCTYGGNPLYSDDPGLGPTTFNHFEGCYGIWGNQRHVESAWGHELPWRDRNTSSWDEPTFWVTEYSYVH